MVYPRTLWLIVSALASPLVNMAAAQSTPPDAVKTAPSSRSEQESAFRPCAVSQNGAQGLMQLMPATAEQFGVRNPFDIQDNVGGGARFFKELLTRYTGNVSLDLGAYKAGPSKVDQAGGVPAIPETTNYVREILRKLALPPADPKPPVE
jgi:hypothetical protein